MYGVNESFDSRLLYFTSSSCLKDGSGLVFIGEEDGNPNVYYRDYATNTTRRLSDNREGTLKSYVYFNGNVNRGFGKASACLDNTRGLVYYLQGRKVCRVDLNGEIRVLAEVPEDQVTAFMHVSADGKKLCVPTTDARALESEHRDGPATLWPGYDIDERVQKENLCSYLRVYDTESGEELLCERVAKAWITHVQFHPQNSDWILYNHEWASHCGIRRMWLWDGQYHRALRTLDKGRRIEDWVCHEMWSEDGSEIIYHGSYAEGGLFYIGRITLATGEIKEIALPKAYHSYGHFTISKDGLLVSDGYYVPDSVLEQAVGKDYSGTDFAARWISVQKVDWEKGTIEWFPLEEHNSSWQNQDTHPHPIFSPDGKRVYYTTDASRKLEVRSCPVPEAALR